jgi:gluconolactonase
VSGPRIPFAPSTRLPDGAFEILSSAGRELRLFSACVEQIATGLRWAEGPVWFGDGRYLLVSDIPNDRILRWDDCNGEVSVFRQPSGNANGHARDQQGRLVSCEHLGRRVTRTEHDGRIDVMANRFDGKPLNSPNDITVAADGAVWFTDPDFGIGSDWEGLRATPEQPHGVYRIEPHSGELQRVLDDLAGPNGLAFTPDGKRLLVVESRAQPHRLIWSYAVDGATLSDKRLLIDAEGHGAFDGIALDTEGRIWCGFGSDGQPSVDAALLDGVRVYSASGEPIAHVHLPERCANLCFGGAKGNRLFMASSHSVYALYVNARGLVL